MNKHMTSKILVPPLKIQGIKTKLIPFIKANITFSDWAIYYEPFMDLVWLGLI